jgi:hypothetical protein
VGGHLPGSSSSDGEEGNTPVDVVDHQEG